MDMGCGRILVQDPTGGSITNDLYTQRCKVKPYHACAAADGRAAFRCVEGSAAVGLPSVVLTGIVLNRLTFYKHTHLRWQRERQCR